jgi:UDP-N-acetylmuramate dehydrogenase
MQAHALLSHDVALDAFNTFRLAARARDYLRVTDPAQLAAIVADPVLAARPRLVLGGGSNLLFVSAEVEALVLHMALEGKEVVGETDGAVLVRARAGESWHGFVEWTIAQGLGGLENLALIPGTVGASPIQNIGAYGAEVKDTFHALTAFDFATGATRTLAAADCRFGYRDSVFKHAEGAQLAVLDVTFALPRAWTPNLRYAELAHALEGVATPTPRQVADAVIAVRRRKLPDPAEIGNAGSFFKNPVVSREHCARLLQAWPDLVHHAQPDGGEKLAAGWLIDRCGWKGRSLGRAGVYPKQALVLVNQGGASGADVLALARAIQADVRARFDVGLEPEPVMV